MTLPLPDRRNTVYTGPEDPLGWYYFPVMRRIYLKRLQMALDFCRPSGRRVLDIGYGSGVFFKALAPRFAELHGIDVHGLEKEVCEALARDGLRTELRGGSIYALPYPDGHFDQVMAVSVFEHLDQTKKAIAEVWRVLAPGGEAVIGIPSDHPVMTFLFFFLGQFHIHEQHVVRPEEVLAALETAFEVAGVAYFPVRRPRLLNLYTALRLKKR